MTETVRLILAVAWVSAMGLASWRLPPAWRPFALIAGGAGLLALLSWPSLLCLAVATYATYRVGHLSHYRLAAGIVTVVSIATVYLLLIWRAGALPDNDALRLVVPLGMAYYVLRLIHYLIEMDRDGLRAHSLADYAAYQFFPATLPVGPIHRFDDFLRDLRRRRWDSEQASQGAGRILGGLIKVVLLDEYLLNQKLGPVISQLHHHGPLVTIYADTVVYWLNIYLQFSGYSSVAIGIGALLGFAIAENFNWPFLAANIGEFWRRWHMTLSFWCRDYVYTPVMAVSRRPVFATTASMLVLGLWHAVSLHYLIWGLYHATGLAVWRRWQGFKDRTAPRVPPLVSQSWNAASRFLTLNFVMFSYPTANALEKWMMSR